mmetsp:Transcript_5209/g.12091  ORF Transcript_5209/g.12091 Transcript_5209/m.12091 type:complete len:490 (-) Transcript_5209:40-1509(-)
MAGNHPRKKRLYCDPPLPGNDYLRTALVSNSLVDRSKVIDQRVEAAVKVKTLALTSRNYDLQRENESLRLRCESLERSIRILKKEGNWTYRSPNVWLSWFGEQGHEEGHVFGVRRLIQSIEATTKDLRASRSAKVDVGGEEGSLILSNDVMDPHWEQLANAMLLSKRIKRMNLSNVQLNERTLQTIEASVRQKGITRFYLRRNKFLGGEGVQFAINVLKNNSSIKAFRWRDNSFPCTEHACQLIDAISEHPAIHLLDLSRSMNKGIIPTLPVKRLLYGLRTDTLKMLYLSNNNIKMNGDRCIPDVLSKNLPLEALFLEGNQLTDDDALHIAIALQSNTNLRYLDLDDNALTNTGKTTMYLLSVLGLNRSDLSDLEPVWAANLNAVSEANHTCKIVGVSGSRNFMNRKNESAKWNRGRKLLSLLVKRHRRGPMIPHLESEFLENGMGLVPHVFSCINSYSVGCSERHCLSILFELVRDWRMHEIVQSRQM